MESERNDEKNESTLKVLQTSGGADDGNIIISDVLQSESYLERQLLSPTPNKAKRKKE